MKDAILNYRMKNGLSQIELAKKCGISPTTLAKIEKGQKPSVIVAGKIKNVIKEG